MTEKDRGEERRELSASLAPPELGPDAHKGDAGRVLTLCGSRAMPGAAILVARAAQRAGAGLVTVGCLDPELMQIVPAAAPEAVLLEIQNVGNLAFELPTRAPDALVAGPGLGASERTRALVELLLGAELRSPLVLDADALNVLAGRPEQLRERRGPLVITPHPGEAGRLLGRDVPRDGAGRERCARELVERTGAIVVLKGHATVVADREHVYVNDTGNPGMATAGAGDVLVGILAAYLALVTTLGSPAWTPLVATCAAVRAHGLAGDLAAAHLGRRALIASDLIAWLAAAQKRIEASAAQVPPLARES